MKLFCKYSQWLKAFNCFCKKRFYYNPKFPAAINYSFHLNYCCFCYKQIGSEFSPQSCLCFKGFWKPNGCAIKLFVKYFRVTGTFRNMSNI